VANPKKLFKKMIDYLEKERRNLNQFYLATSHTLTELYKTDSFIELLKSTTKKLNHLILIHEKLKKAVPAEIMKDKKYSKLINNIAVELHILKATSNAMDENLNEIKKSEMLQYRTSRDLANLKKEINKSIKKAEQILNN
jgi:hypothetical protein